MFSSFIMLGGDEDVTSRLLGFLVRHQKEIFVAPLELVSEVQRERKAKIKQKVSCPNFYIVQKECMIFIVLKSMYALELSVGLY